MNEILSKFLDAHGGVLPALKVELFRMNVRFRRMLRIAKEAGAQELKYEIDEFENKRYIMLEGLVPYGTHKSIHWDSIETFRMLAEMQMEEDKYADEKVAFTGYCTYIVEKGDKGVYFRVDMPFSPECVRIMGGMSFFVKYLHIIGQEGRDECGIRETSESIGTPTEDVGGESGHSDEGTGSEG